MSAARADLHRLVDDVPDSETSFVRRVLQLLRDAGGDPVLRTSALAKLLDPEDLTADEGADLDEARRELDRGEVVDHEEARRLLDL